MPTVASLAEQIDSDLHRLVEPSVAAMRKTRREWSRLLRNRDGAEVYWAALELFERFGQRWVAYELLAGHEEALNLVSPVNIERWAGQLRGWGDVDQFGVLLAGPAWRAGQIDEDTVHGWAGRGEASWRRAALAATVPLNVRSRGGRGDVARTLAVCELLVDDRDDLVVKALSWALRELVVHDRAAVEAFLRAHGEVLAARVRREVGRKLATGLKSGSGRS